MPTTPKPGLIKTVGPVSPPRSLEEARRLKKLLAQDPRLAKSQFEFKAGEIIIRQDELREWDGALLVVDGTLVEEQERFVPDMGRQTRTVHEAEPGMFAFAQGVSDRYRGHPSFVTVRAATDGKAATFARSTFGDDLLAELVTGLIASQARNMEELWLFSRTTQVFGLLHEIVKKRQRKFPLANVESLVLRMSTLQKERDQLAAEALQAGASVRETIEAFEREMQQLQERKRDVETQEIAGLVRWRGMEEYIDRVRAALGAMKLPTEEIEMTAEEMEKFLGEDQALADQFLDARHAKEQASLAEIDLDLDRVFDRRISQRPPAALPAPVEIPRAASAPRVRESTVEVPRDMLPAEDRGAPEPRASMVDEIEASTRTGIPALAKKPDEEDVSEISADELEEIGPGSDPAAQVVVVATPPSKPKPRVDGGYHLEAGELPTDSFPLSSRVSILPEPPTQRPATREDLMATKPDPGRTLRGLPAKPVPPSPLDEGDLEDEHPSRPTITGIAPPSQGSPAPPDSWGSKRHVLATTPEFAEQQRRWREENLTQTNIKKPR